MDIPREIWREVLSFHQSPEAKGVSRTLDTIETDLTGERAMYIIRRYGRRPITNIINADDADAIRFMVSHSHLFHLDTRDHVLIIDYVVRKRMRRTFSLMVKKQSWSYYHDTMVRVCIKHNLFSYVLMALSRIYNPPYVKYAIYAIQNKNTSMAEFFIRKAPLITDNDMEVLFVQSLTHGQYIITTDILDMGIDNYDMIMETLEIDAEKIPSDVMITILEYVMENHDIAVTYDRLINIAKYLIISHRMDPDMTVYMVTLFGRIGKEETGIMEIGRTSVYHNNLLVFTVLLDNGLDREKLLSTLNRDRIPADMRNMVIRGRI